MLDDLKYIARRDKSDALGAAQKAPAQLRHNFDLPAVAFKGSQVDNVVLAGMGGSALAANLFVSWTSPGLPFVINRQYEVPGFVGDKTLFIASSHSGNTEEVLSALDLAKDRGAHIVVMASGGELIKRAEPADWPILKIPTGLQPRMSVFYGIKALAVLFEKLGLMRDLSAQLDKTADYLEQAVQAWLPEVATSQNPAKELAEELAGKTPIVYAGPRLSSAAYKWKISFNETSKNLAWNNQWSEFNHNEFVGWTSHPTDKPFQPIELKSSFEHERILRRFDISNRLLSGRMPHPIEIEAEGNTLIEQILWTVLYGDFVSIYLALLNNVDPTPVDLIEKLKKELNK